MGYGSLNAVEALRDAGIKPFHSPGFRSAILIVDEEGWSYTPTARYLEAEPQSDETPNAIRLNQEQATALLLRISPTAHAEVSSETEVTLEIGCEAVDEDQYRELRRSIEAAPPVDFDVARQVRVFEPYLQYIELSLSGAAVQRHRVRIPVALQNLGSSRDLEGKLKTTFDLIEKGSSLSSEKLDQDLRKIRDDFTRSMGKKHGRVILKSVKPLFQERLKELRQALEAHQKKVSQDLQANLDRSREQVIDHYLPLVKSNPPDSLIASVIALDEASIRRWIDGQLQRIFPQAEDLIGKMVLEDHYKDVTFETLNEPEFFEQLEKAYSEIDWRKPYRDFLAAGEKTGAKELD